MKILTGLVSALLFTAVFLFAQMGEGNMQAAQSKEMQMGKGNGMMQMFQSVPETEAELLQSGKEKLYCPNCGMNLPKFYKTNHLVKLKDGSVRQYCSLYCLVEESEITYLRDKKDMIEHIMVVDVPSKKFIDVKDAHYVVGSGIKGTMTNVSKYAFKNLEDAKAFAAKNGGEIMNYKEAYNAALKDFAKDTAFVLKNRESKMYSMGEKLYETKCDKEKLSKTDLHTMAEMKAYVRDSGICGSDLNDGQLQAITLFYWDKKLMMFEKTHGKNLKIADETK